MKNVNIILIIIFITNIFSTCEKVVREPDKYSFKMASSILPDNDSIHVGDTITLEIHGLIKQIDSNSRQVINFDKANNLSTSVYFDKLAFDSTTLGSLTFSTNAFATIVENGKAAMSSFPERIKQFGFEENNGEYLLKLKIIPLDTGLFSITLQDLPLIYRNSDRNTKATYFVTIANTEQHLYYMENYLPDLIIDDNLSRHLYCFKVYK